MPSKLLTLKELSEYLNITEEKIIKLVEQKVIFAYKIGGELLRFRKEQIDAIRSEIDSRTTEKDKLISGSAHATRISLGAHSKKMEEDSVSDKWSDFLYFNDFYISPPGGNKDRAMAVVVASLKEEVFSF